MERPSTPPAYHHGDLRNALISEGRRLLEEVGAHELSLRHVARSVGVSIAAPSHHFDGKEGLLAAMAAEGFNELASARRKIAASEQDLLRRAWRMMDCYVRFAEKQRGLFDLMVGPRILPRGHQDLTAAAAASFDLFASAVSDYARTKGWREEDLNLVVHAAWSVEHGLATLIIAHRVPFPGRKVDLKRMIHFSVSMMLGAIAAGPDHVRRIVASTS